MHATRPSLSEIVVRLTADEAIALYALLSYTEWAGTRDAETLELPDDPDAARILDDLQQALAPVLNEIGTEHYGPRVTAALAALARDSWLRDNTVTPTATLVDRQTVAVPTGDAPSVTGDDQSASKTAAGPYVTLLTALVESRISADDFETLYLTLYKNDPTMWDDDHYQALEGMFGEVDAYHPDPVVRRETRGVDAAHMRSRAADTLARLRRLATP